MLHVFTDHLIIFAVVPANWQLLRWL